MDLSARAAAAGLLGVLLPSTPLAAGQVPTVESVQVRAALLVDAAAVNVTAAYRFRGLSGGIVELTAVPFFGLDITGVEASANGAPLTATRAVGGRRLEVRIPVPAGTSELEVRYTVPDAGAVRGEVLTVRAPILLPRAMAVAAGDAFFRATLVAFDGMRVVETFPTVAPAYGSDSSAHSVTLPVAPGLLAWRLTAGSGQRLTFAGTVDVAVVLLLAVLAVLGIRVLRRPQESS